MIVYRVEDALAYQATWAAFALQSKVLTTFPLSSHEWYSLTSAFLQDLSESAAAVRRKQKITYDNLGELAKNKTKL